MNKFSENAPQIQNDYAGGNNSLWNEISQLVDKHITPSQSDPNLVITGKAETVANICAHIDKECAKDAVSYLKKLQANPYCLSSLKQSIENDYLKINKN